MTTKHVTGLHVLLSLVELDDDPTKRASLAAAVAKMAPTSPLFTANPALQAEVTTLATTYATFVSTGATADASAKQAKSDAAAHDLARIANNKSFSVVKLLTENGAATEADIKTMALVPDPGPPAAPAMVAPAQIDVTTGKKGSAKAKATVYEVGPKHHYAAQGSTDGGVTWAVLPGVGKSRKLSGKSGTSMLVQFALVRGQLQSPWSQAVTVTFP